MRGRAARGASIWEHGSTAPIRCRKHDGDADIAEHGLQDYGPKTLVDAQVNYEITDGVTFSVGADNLLDVYPDEQELARVRAGCIAADGTTGATGMCGADPIVDTNGVFVYSRRAAPFGFNGGFYYARLTLRY